MRNGNGVASLAVCAALLMCANVTMAEEPSSSSSDLSLQPAYLDAAPPRKPLMDLLDKAGLAKPIEDAGFNVYGWVEGSYTYSASSPPGNFIAGRVFDFEHEDPTLNQLDLVVERTVDSTKGKWDIGGRMEWMYGADARLIHSNGLFDSDGVNNGPNNQFDLTQAYIDVAVPVGNGLLVRAGKMVTHMGYETINPTTNPFYSHSFMFGYAIPFTHTGVMAFYNLTDKITVMGGFSRGWEQSLEDDNDSLDGLGQVKWIVNDKLTMYFNFTTGPEAAGDNSHWRTVGDFIASYAVSDKFTLALNADLGYEAAGAIDGGDAWWYGVAGYAGYTLCKSATLNGRVEWFADPDGARGLNTDGVYEATLGLTLTPFPDNAWGSNLKIRPEVRVDYSNDTIFDGGTDDYQVTAAVDAYFTY